MSSVTKEMTTVSMLIKQAEGPLECQVASVQRIEDTEAAFSKIWIAYEVLDGSMDSYTTKHDDLTKRVSHKKEKRLQREKEHLEQLRALRWRSLSANPSQRGSGCADERWRNPLRAHNSINESCLKETDLFAFISYLVITIWICWKYYTWCAWVPEFTQCSMGTLTTIGLYTSVPEFTIFCLHLLQYNYKKKINNKINSFKIKKK